MRALLTAAALVLAASSAGAQQRTTIPDIAQRNDVNRPGGVSVSPLISGTIRTPDELIQRLVSINLADFKYAKARAKAAGNFVTLPCWAAWVDLLEKAQATLKDDAGTDLVKPDPHAFSDLEAASELLQALQVDGRRGQEVGGSAHRRHPGRRRGHWRPPAVPDPMTGASDHAFSSNRLFEWTTAAMMVGIAFCVAVSPKTISFGGFYLMQDVGLTPEIIGVAFTLGGCLRAAALFANGNWPVYGPMCRVVGAALGAVLWAQMSWALYRWSLAQGYVSIGVVVYGCLTLSEMISCGRAARDGRPR